MGCCGSSLFNKNASNRNIKFTCGASGPSLTVLNGATTVSKIDMCDWSENYSQFSQSQVYLSTGTINHEINYGGLGTAVMFLFIKIKYVSKLTQSPIPMPSSNGFEEPYITYIFETEPTIVRPIDEMMMLTGTNKHKIPKVFLSNPNKYYDAVVDVMIATESITYDQINVIPIGDKVITVENLYWNNLKSDKDYLYVNSTSGTALKLRWIDITYYPEQEQVEINGKIVSLLDYVVGTVNLSFVDEYNAHQAYSLIKWALVNLPVNIITGYNPTDDTPPVIHYTSEFTTDIILNDFPPLPSSTCGTAGNSACSYNYQGTNGDNIILKNDLFTFLADYATDNRDINVPFTYNNLTIKPINSINTIDAITSLGLYNIEFNVIDNAFNLRTDSFILNVKDTLPPKLIVSSLGLELINTNGTSGTSGTSGSSTTNIYPNNIITIPIFTGSLDIRFITSSPNEYTYLLIGDTVVEVGSYVLSSITYFVFDNQQVGNGKLIWDTTTELHVTKIFILNSYSYNITWDGFGSLLFNIEYIIPDNHYIVDNQMNFLSDEHGNYLSF